MKPYLLVIRNRIRCMFLHLKCRDFISIGIQMFGRNTKICIDPTSKVQLGDRIVTDGRCVVIVGSAAELEIGTRVYLNEGAMISCKSSVKIGNGCRFGPNVKIFDNDHKFDAIHGVSSEHTTAPVEIGENCWLGANVVVLKGTTIGKNCVIGAGCVVKGSIPDGSLVTQSRELKITPIQER